MVGSRKRVSPELVKGRYSTDLRDSRIADVVVRPFPTSPQDHRTGEHERGSNQAERLSVQPATSHNPTLGHRIHFVYRTSGRRLSEVDAERRPPVDLTAPPVPDFPHGLLPAGVRTD
jgi:hypothetical protein